MHLDATYRPKDYLGLWLVHSIYTVYTHIQMDTCLKTNCLPISYTNWRISLSLSFVVSLYVSFVNSLSLPLPLYPSCVYVNRFTSLSFAYRKKIDNAYVMYMLQNLLIDIDHNFYLFIHSLATETTDRILNNRMNKM